MTTFITKEEFSLIISPYTKHLSSMAVAVSGGPDSLCLLLLLNEWAENFSKTTKITALTVNHNLRKEAKEEADQISSWAKTHDIDHKILTWEHDGNIQSAIQEKAREARHDLLTKWCIENNIPTLVFAHHLYDQFETFIMRLGKGSGVKGLCCMQDIVKTPFGIILRPLLSVTKERLIKTLERFKQPYISDPSNFDNKFTRVKLRQNMDLLKELGLCPKNISKTINKLQMVESCLNSQLRHIEKAYIINNYLHLPTYVNLPLEFCYRILNRFLSSTQKQHYPIAFKTFMYIHQKLIEPSFKGITVSRCYLSKFKKEWIKCVTEPKRSNIANSV
ncbi:MAG: tRNA lysidine(34) synthetase TilS [Alphaproteobacteria bacterium]